MVNSEDIMQSRRSARMLCVADDQVITKSIALVWSDKNFPADAVVSIKGVYEATVFVGFDDDPLATPARASPSDI